MYRRTFKRVMAIHDLSGLGRSSLMAAIPILSVMGVQVCPVPTAVLSTQTSGFSDYTFTDLSKTMPAYLQHWKNLGMDFDGIYSGFLGSAEQVDIMMDVLTHFHKQDTLAVVDPVMGEDGLLYDTMDSSFVEQMSRLVKKADIITPNVTELNFLAGCAGNEVNDVRLLKEKLAQVSQDGPQTVIVTGVELADSSRCILSYTRATDEYLQVPYKHLPINYPGTGDIFASVLTGSLIQGKTLENAIKLAADFISIAVADAMATEEPIRDGVFLETNLYRLLK